GRGSTLPERGGSAGPDLQCSDARPAEEAASGARRHEEQGGAAPGGVVAAASGRFELCLRQQLKLTTGARPATTASPAGWPQRAARPEAVTPGTDTLPAQFAQNTTGCSLYRHVWRHTGTRAS